MNIQVSKNHYTKEKYGSLERFISYFKQIQLVRKSAPASILFIGVGDGVVPYYLKNVLGYNVVTYDFDPSLKPDIVGDVRSLNFEKGEFDVVATFEVLEHIPFEEFQKVISNLSRIAKKAVILSVPFHHTGFEFIFKFPFIRTILNRNFVRLSWSMPTKFPGFEKHGQHYWEIDSKIFTIKKVREVLAKYFKDIQEENLPLYAFHRFFILKK